MKNWIKQILGITKLEEQIETLKKLIGEKTTVHCDVHTKNACEVIVIGNYHNKEYVRCFHLNADSIKSLIEQLKEREKYSRVGKFDMVGLMPFSTVYEKETF
jgi:hypothetical protein